MRVTHHWRSEWDRSSCGTRSQYDPEPAAFSAEPQRLPAPCSPARTYTKRGDCTDHRERILEDRAKIEGCGEKPFLRAKVVRHVAFEHTKRCRSRLHA